MTGTITAAEIPSVDDDGTRAFAMSTRRFVRLEAGCPGRNHTILFPSEARALAAQLLEAANAVEANS